MRSAGGWWMVGWGVLAMGMGSVQAQFGGTSALSDTGRVSDKFHVFQLRDGQRLAASHLAVDTLQATIRYILPQVGAKPTCTVSTMGFFLTDTSNNRAYFCNGSQWRLLVYDGDFDGLTDQIDPDDSTPFVPGTAGAGQVLAGQTFYTGSSMTYTTGTMPNIGTQNITPSTATQYIAGGYHSGGGVVYGDGDLAANNIKSGVNLWGVVGTLANPPPGCGVGATAYSYTGGQNYTDYCDNDHDGQVDEWDQIPSGTIPPPVASYDNNRLMGQENNSEDNNLTSFNQRCKDVFGGAFYFHSYDGQVYPNVNTAWVTPISGGGSHRIWQYASWWGYWINDSEFGPKECIADQSDNPHNLSVMLMCTNGTTISGRN